MKHKFTLWMLRSHRNVMKCICQTGVSILTTDYSFLISPEDIVLIRVDQKENTFATIFMVQ